MKRIHNIMFFKLRDFCFTFLKSELFSVGLPFPTSGLSFPFSWGQGEKDPGNEVVPVHVLALKNYPVSFLVGHARPSPMFCSEI